MASLQSYRSFTTAGPSASATRYNNIWELTGSWTTLESNADCLVGAAGVLRNFTLTVTTAPGAGKSWTITVRVNHSDTAAVLVLADTNTTVTYTASDISVSAGDTVTLRSDPSGTPTGMGQHHFGWEWDPTTDGTSIFGVPRDNLDSTNTVYNGLFTGANGWSTATTNTMDVCALDGAIKNFYVQIGASPGAGNSYEFTIYKNGTKQDGSGGTPDTRVLIADSAETGNASFTLDFAPGDTGYVECVPTSSPTLRAGWFSIAFLADDTSQSMIGAHDSAGPSNTVVNYKQVQDVVGWGTTETLAGTQSITGVSAFSVSDLYVVLTVAPGASKSRVLDVRRNGASPSNTLSVTIADAATTGNDTTHSVSLQQGDYWSVRDTPSGTPASTRVAFMMAMQINTTLNATSRGFLSLDPGATGNRGWAGCI